MNDAQYPGFKDYLLLNSNNNYADRKLLILFHGINCRKSMFLQIAEYIRKIFPQLSILLLDGIEKVKNKQRRWFEMSLGFDLNQILYKLEKITPIIKDKLNYELSRLNFKWSEIVLVGFSQGGLLTSYLVNAINQKLLANIILSAPYVSQDTKSTIKKSEKDITDIQIKGNYVTDICMIAGKLDHVINIDVIKHSYENLLLGAKIKNHKDISLQELHIIDNMNHICNEEAITKLINFLKQKFI